MNREKELAYRYDLLITPTWRDRFDTLVNENLQLPEKGRVLDVNCGTGAHAIELAERMRGLGDVIGIDPDVERLELSRAKAQAKKVEDVTFECGDARELELDDNDFNVVIGDASMTATAAIEPIFKEMMRVADHGATVILKLATHGSFDEFFSIFWEALLRAGISEEVWGKLEALINDRLTVSAARQMAERAGLRQVVSIVEKEEFDFESAEAFLEAPMIKDVFLDDWLGIVPEEKRPQVLDEIASIIEEERHDSTFDVSIKATLIKGVK